MLSVKAGIDNNPDPTQADRIAGAKMKDPFTGKDFILDTRPDRPMDILKDIERKKYGGSVGVKMAKGGFKNKTPIY